MEFPASPSQADAWCLGRGTELSEIGRLLGDTSPGPRAVVFEGEAGIGKSTLWGAGLAEAMRCGYTVLSTRGTQSETGLSFAGLTDLFDEVIDDVLPALPEPQRVALEVALLRRLPGDTPSGQRAVGAATLGALRLLCANRQVLLAIDDLPWTDRATRDAVAFALRRLRTESLRLLATRRISGGLSSDEPDNDALSTRRAVPIGSIRSRRLGPLDASTIERLVTERLGAPLPRRTMRLLIERTAGNPFWALEVGVALAATGAAAGAVPELPVPESLSSLVASRIAGISRPAREALLVISAMSHPPLQLAARALTGVVDDPVVAIDAAVSAGVVSESGARLRPSHPLLGSAALEALPRWARADLHRRLAGVVFDPEQHARHRALAAGDGPDASVAAALDAGATAARSKGAIHVAIELVEQAIRLTPPEASAELARRRIDAAEHLFSVGEMERAAEQASAVDLGPAPADQYRRVLPLLVEATYWVRGHDAAQALVRLAVEESEVDQHLHAVALAVAADVGDGVRPQIELARQALKEFEQVDGEPDPAGLMTALIMLASLRLSTGEGLDLELLERAEAVERKVSWAPMANRPSVIRGSWLRVIDDLTGARNALEQAICTARKEGEDGALPVLLGHLALTECWAGRYVEAASAADEGLRRAGSGALTSHVLHAARGLLYAVTGELPAAIALTEQRLGSSDRPTDNHQAVHFLPVLGLIALLQGDSERAVDLLERGLTAGRTIGWLDPGRRMRPEGDLGQALVDTGRLRRAAELADELTALGERARRPAVLGVGLRIDGLVRGARGDLDEAATLLRRAVAAHERSEFPLEHGRSLLALGQTERRRRAKPAARKALESALDRFVALGATPFAELAEAELTRVRTARTGATLTKTEQRVAELVSTGLTNREVSAKLFTSVRTVEGHLAAIYRKLGVRSRTELARTYSQRRTS